MTLIPPDRSRRDTGSKNGEPTEHDGAPLAMRDRVSLRSVGVGAATFGTPVGLGVLHPALGQAIAIIELIVALVIIGTALFGSSAVSERVPSPALDGEPA